MFQAINNQKGNILMITLLVLTSTLAICLGSAVIIAQGIIMHRTMKWSTTAYFSAEAGAEYILNEIRKKGIKPPDTLTKADGAVCEENDYIRFNPLLSPLICGGVSSCCETASASPPPEGNPLNIGMESLNQAYFNVKYNSDSTRYVFTATGNYQDEKRTVEISYIK